MKKILISLFIISLATRLFFLFFGMSSITHDEADFYYSGYTLARTGADQYGNKVFLTSGFLSAIPSVPVYVSGLTFKLVHAVNPITARLPFALINSFTPVLLFFIVWRLTDNRRLSLLTFTIMNFSPWFSHLSSTAAFDAPVSLCFSLGALAVLLSDTKHSRIRIGFFILLNFLAFNSYMGFKTVFPFFFFLQMMVANIHRHKGKDSKHILRKTVVYGIISIAVFLVFFGMLYIFPKSSLLTKRSMEDVVLFNTDLISHEQWYANYTTIGSRIIQQIFNNKAMVVGQLFFAKYLQSFYPNIYFLTGDPQTIYGLRILGLFYFSDFLFFIIAILTLGRNTNNAIKILLLTLFIGGIPIGLSTVGYTFALRGILLILPYSLLIALGYEFVYKRVPHLRPFLVLLMIVNIIAFNVLYQTRIKTMSKEAWRFTDMEAIQKSTSYGTRVEAYVFEPREFYLLHVFYNAVNPVISKTVLAHRDSKLFEDPEFSVHAECDFGYSLKSDTVYLIDPQRCQKEMDAIVKQSVILEKLYSKDMDNRLMFYLLKKP